MVKTLLSLLARLRSAWLFELAGAAAVTAGVYLIHGWAGALLTVGAAALVKSAELDARP